MVEKARTALRLRHRLEGPDDLTLAQRLDRRELGGKTWTVEGKTLTKNQVVAYALDALATGERGLPFICAKPGMPSLPTLVGWINHNPEWQKARKLAEECQALVMADNAQARARSAGGGDMVGVKGDELYIKQCNWMAERLDRKKWSEKGETPDLADPLANASERDLINRIVAGLLAAPAMMEQLAPRLKQILPPEKVAEVQAMVLAARQQQAIEGELAAVEADT